MLKPETGILQANVDLNGIARRLAAQYPEDKDIAPAGHEDRGKSRAPAALSRIEGS